MKNSADGSRFVDHTVTTVTGTETIDAQDPAATSRRSVFTYNGKKYFKSNLIIGDADLANSGFINYYAGRELSPGDRVVFYSRVRVNQTSGDTSVQWQFKGARFGKGPSEQYDPDNSCYLKIAPSTNGTAVDDYHGATSRSLFYSGGPNRAGALVDELFFWKQNTPDGDDGYQLTLGANGASFTRDIPYISGAPNTGTSVIKSSHANRTDHLKVQDYCANGSGIGVEVLRGDTMFQVNGSVFAICDSVSEGSRTRFQALPPVEIIAPNMCFHAR
jgi:hypothetical protein